MKNTFDSTILDTGRVIKRGYSFFLENAGKTVALLTGFIVTLVTFTEVGLCDVGTADYTSTLILMLIASYIIYFSLEESGEKLGRESEEYRTAAEEYSKRRKILREADVYELRSFLYDYAREELLYRQKNTLMAKGFSTKDYEAWQKGEKFPHRAVRTFRAVKRMRPVKLTPKQLLTRERAEGRSELTSPEGRKLFTLIVKLIPSTVCMIFTLSIMLGAKDGMTAEFIIESLLKLSCLPVIGLKGYTQGYAYAKGDLVLWIETKTRLIDTYIKGTKKPVDTAQPLC